MAVSPVDIYQVYLDPTKDVASKTAAINMLYGVPPPDMGPDLRTADISNLPAAVTKPMGSDPSLVAATVDADERQANDAIRRSLSPSSALSHAAPAPPSVAPVPAATTPATPATPAVPSPAPTAPGQTANATEAGPSGQAMTDAGIRAVFGPMLRGSRGVVVPAHDQPTSSVVEQREPIPDELKTAIGIEALHGSARAIQAGEHEAKAHLDAAIAADLKQKQYEQEREAFAERQQYEQDHARQMDEGFEKLVKDTEVRPGDWWASKDTGHKILSVISAVMFGLAGKPDALQKIIDNDIALKQANREKTLGARKHAIDDFRATMLSPEAANAADRALAAQAAAAEATRLAESAKAPEARDRALQIAADQQAKFNQFMVEMAAHEAKAVRTNIAHVGAHVSGGPGNPIAVLQQAHKLGLNTEGVLRVLSDPSGHYEEGDATMTADQRNQKLSEIERSVPVLDGKGTVLYANSGTEATKLKEGINAATNIRNAYGQLLALLGKEGRSISPTDLAEINTIIAQNMVELKNSNALGAITKADEAIIKPLSGEAVGDTVSFDSSTRAGINKAMQLLDIKKNTVLRSLYRDPWSNKRPGGVTAEEVTLP